MRKPKEIKQLKNNYIYTKFHSKMKTKILLSILAISSFAANAQNDNPYEAFGYKSKVIYETPSSDLFTIINRDTSSLIKAMAFNIEESYVIIIGKNDSVIRKEKVEPNQILRFISIDPHSSKYPSLSPYNFVDNNPITNIDPDGRDIVVTTKQGKELFRLDDGKTKITVVTAKQLYDKGTQWFEPGADNYMPMKSMAKGIETFSELKHFTWNQVAEFAETDRWMTSYTQGGSGDWKKSSEGADGYLMVTIGGKPYWADAIGQIPFAVDNYTDNLEKTGDPAKSRQMTIQKGKEYGEGKLFGGKTDNSNTYDNYFILRGINYASEKYKVGEQGMFGFGDFNLTPTNYSPSNMGTPASKAPDSCPSFK